MDTHGLDLLEWIMNAPIIKIADFQDRLTQTYPTDIKNTSTVIARFANGAHGIIDNYFNLPNAAAQNALELHNSKGSILATGTIGQDPTGEMFSILQPATMSYQADQVHD